MNTTNKLEPSNNGLQVVYLRNDFYKKKFHTLFGMFLLSLFGIGILSSMLVYLIKHPPHPLYFVADPVGRLIQDVSVQEPNMSLDDVTAWAIEAVTTAYTYSYMNYRNELQKTQKYFTTYGWRNYMSGLQASNNLDALTKRKYIQLGAVVQRPQLVVQGHMGSVYAYKFRMPVLVTYWYPPYDDKSKFYNPLMITLTIQRVDLLQSYKGLGIVQMNAELMTSGASS
jgi:intracellular multiplication protein IcmL